MLYLPHLTSPDIQHTTAPSLGDPQAIVGEAKKMHETIRSNITYFSELLALKDRYFNALRVRSTSGISVLNMC